MYIFNMGFEPAPPPQASSQNLNLQYQLPSIHHLVELLLIIMSCDPKLRYIIGHSQLSWQHVI